MRSAILSSILVAVVPALAAQDRAAFYIPVAGELSGVVNYSTEIHIDNRRAAAQRLRVGWLGQDGAGSRETALTLELGPHESRTIFAAALLDHGAGLGSAKIVATDDSGAPDASAIIETSAVISAARSDGSVVTQEVASVPFRDARGGLDGNADRVMTFYPVPMRGMLPAVVSRNNYGIVNDADDAGVFTVEIRFPNFPQLVYEESVTVPPRAMLQRSLRSDFSSPVDDSRGIVTIRREGGAAGRWLAYVSSINVRSGDARLIRPLPPFGRHEDIDEVP
jgi:hypothetical protein